MNPEPHNLPVNQNPEGDYCVTLFIPADSQFVALLVGALSVLENPEYYEKSIDFTDSGAKAVAAQWRDRTITPLIEALVNAQYCEE